jgi:Tol biopolymer transport system component
MRARVRPAPLRATGIVLAALCFFGSGGATVRAAASPAAEIFTKHTDIGAPSRPGTVVFDASRGTYTIGGGGANMWFKTDSFHFVWEQVSGDIALQADVAFVGQSAQPHRKACLVIRQSLDPDSAYADVALHGDGLTSLQFRAATGEVTREVQTAISAPQRLRIEKIGDTVYMSLAGADGVFHPSGCSARVPFTGPFYLGLGVCAHDKDAFETAVFSNVEIGAPSASVKAVRSSLETITIASRDRRSVHHSNEVIEAPNWSRDGAALIFNGGGRIYRLPLAPGARPELIDTGFAVKCNNDHGLSPDGSLLAISDQTKDGSSRIYVLPATGGTPKEITAKAPSYWHGWSPDGLTLAYCAQRDGKFGICTIPAAGGEEKRLTTTDGLDDGPDYSPDGQWIYFNSDRTGRMQIWRMHPDGTAIEQVTHDDYNNWFAHPSPDGKWLVFLTFAPDVQGHPPDKDVRLRLMPVGGGEITVLAELFGGQGTNNVPSWSPDSTKVAYVRYQPKQ